METQDGLQLTYPEFLCDMYPIDLSRSGARDELLHSVDLRLRPLGVVKTRVAFS